MKDEREQKLQKVLDRLKSVDDKFELRQEFGRFLMRHINDLSEQELKRYNELKELLKN